MWTISNIISNLRKQIVKKIDENEILSVVVPVYNEKEFVELSLTGLIQTSFPSLDHLEVIVVDDGSTDGTREILKKLQNKFSFLYLEHGENLGKSAALKTGIKAATGKYFVIHDADLEYDPKDINKLLEPMQQGKADVVYGSRFVGSEMRRLLFYWHEKGNKLITMFMNMFTNLNFTDVATCYKMFKTQDLKEMNLKADRFDAEFEMTIKAAKKKLRFYEVAISYNGRTYAQGKKITWKDGVRALRCMLKFTFFDHE